MLLSKLRTLHFSWWTYSLAILFLGVLAYGIHIPFMGFYWDDWPWIWFSNVMGPAGMLRIDIEHRPITGVVLWLGSILAGNNPVGWQIYNLVLRLVGAVSLGWFLKKLWPRQREQIIWVVLLFLILKLMGTVLLLLIFLFGSFRRFWRFFCYIENASP